MSEKPVEESHHRFESKVGLIDVGLSEEVVEEEGSIPFGDKEVGEYVRTVKVFGPEASDSRPSVELSVVRRMTGSRHECWEPLYRTESVPMDTLYTFVFRGGGLQYIRDSRSLPESFGWFDADEIRLMLKGETHRFTVTEVTGEVISFCKFGIFGPEENVIEVDPVLLGFDSHQGCMRFANLGWYLRDSSYSGISDNWQAVSEEIGFNRCHFLRKDVESACRALVDFAVAVRSVPISMCPAEFGHDPQALWWIKRHNKELYEFRSV